jgi:hypothetical protein
MTREPGGAGQAVARLRDAYRMPLLGFALAIIAATLIIVGSFWRRRSVAIAGYSLLVLFALLVVWVAMQPGPHA